MAKKKGIDIGADFSEAGFAMGVVSGTERTIRTDRFSSDVIEYVHHRLSEQFDLAADVAYGAAPKMFHHVYEWGTKGGKDLGRDRLWEHKLLGSGARRNATWTWRASLRPVPSPAERAKNPDDPMSLVPAEEIARLSKRKHFFYWKAPVMEYNVPVNIEPVNGKMIFIPTGDPENPFTFSRGVRSVNPGGTETTGAFTALWTGFWGSGSSAYQEAIQEGIEKDISQIQTGMRLGTRRRTNKVRLGAATDYHDSFAKGEEWARMFLYKKSTAYKRRGQR